MASATILRKCLVSGVMIGLLSGPAAMAWGQPRGKPVQDRAGRPRPKVEEQPGLRAPPPGHPYGEGVKELQVDAGRVVGKIRSLLGVNRGPLSFPRRPGERQMSHVESYRRLGVDFIRTHDFYGPTDWHVIFPDWTADPLTPASYDFASSDARVRAIMENGFQCLYRLGTSWKGEQQRPINDPPGTMRGPDGQVTHAADRSDFQKWAAICAQTVRHYTDGWNQGFHYPVEYWEIWNEPDLAAQFWTGTPEQYYMLYEEAAKAIKKVNPKLKVGGPACTGGLRPAYVEDFVRYCAEHQAPLDFFSWHSYGGRGEFNPYQYFQDARRVREALDRHGFQKTENLLTEWNAGIQRRLFSDTPAGAAYYASTLACLLDAGVDRAFQYCGDRHPGLGLHDLQTGQPKICTDAFAAWKRLLETPERLAATGGDQRGYNLVAGRSADGRRVHVLVSDFQSGHDAMRLRVTNLPWDANTPVTTKRLLLNAEHRLEVVEEKTITGAQVSVECPFRSPSVCLVELESALLGEAVSAKETKVVGRTKWLHLSSVQGDLPAAGIGRQVASLIQDIDKDGVNDFVIASYEKIVWYRYNSTKGDWAKYRIENDMPAGSLEAGGDFYDIDGDGAPDLVMGAAYRGDGYIWWWKNPYPHFDSDTPWQRHVALQVGKQHHDQIFGDFDGDGKVELAFFDNRAGKLYLARIPADPKTNWPYREIYSLPAEGGRPEGLAKADVNGDGKLDIIGGGWWFEHLHGEKFAGHPINSSRQFSRSAVGNFMRGGRPQILLGSGDDVGPLEMYQWDGKNWIAKTLIHRLDHGHTLQVGDINGDGNLDILAGEMHTPGPKDKCQTYVLYGDGTGNFETHVLSVGIGCHESRLGDLNGDGRLDVLQKDFQKDQRVDLWLNQGPAK